MHESLLPQSFSVDNDRGRAYVCVAQARKFQNDLLQSCGRQVACFGSEVKPPRAGHYPTELDLRDAGAQSSLHGARADPSGQIMTPDFNPRHPVSFDGFRSDVMLLADMGFQG